MESHSRGVNALIAGDCPRAVGHSITATPFHPHHVAPHHVQITIAVLQSFTIFRFDPPFIKATCSDQSTIPQGQP